MRTKRSYHKNRSDALQQAAQRARLAKAQARTAAGPTAEPAASVRTDASLEQPVSLEDASQAGTKAAVLPSPPPPAPSIAGMPKAAPSVASLAQLDPQERLRTLLERLAE